MKESSSIRPHPPRVHFSLGRAGIRIATVNSRLLGSIKGAKLRRRAGLSFHDLSMDFPWFMVVLPVTSCCVLVAPWVHERR
jgi:hypothetical protein